MLIDPRNGPEHDLAASAAGVFIIASVPRSGSTLLARTLWEMGLGAPKEYLNPMQLRDWEVRLGTPRSRLAHLPLRRRGLALVGHGWSRERLVAHLERVRARRTGRWFGMKIHWHHLQRWGLDLEEILGDVHWIRMRREDRLAQAISWTRALGSGDWVARQDGRTAHVAYSRRAIERRLAAIAAAEAGWSAFFRARSCLEVSYEQLVTEREQSVHRVLDWLGEPRQPVPVPQLRRQSGEASERWRDRFLAGARD